MFQKPEIWTRTSSAKFCHFRLLHTCGFTDLYFFIPSIHAPDFDLHSGAAQRFPRSTRQTVAETNTAERCVSLASIFIYLFFFILPLLDSVNCMSVVGWTCSPVFLVKWKKKEIKNKWILSQSAFMATTLDIFIPCLISATSTPLVHGKQTKRWYGKLMHSKLYVLV